MDTVEHGSGADRKAADADEGLNMANDRSSETERGQEEKILCGEGSQEKEESVESTRVIGGIQGLPESECGGTGAASRRNAECGQDVVNLSYAREVCRNILNNIKVSRSLLRNGKILDADPKLQGAMTRCVNLLGILDRLSEEEKQDEVASPSSEQG